MSLTFHEDRFVAALEDVANAIVMLLETWEYGQLRRCIPLLRFATPVDDPASSGVFGTRCGNRNMADLTPPAPPSGWPGADSLEVAERPQAVPVLLAQRQLRGLPAGLAVPVNVQRLARSRKP